MQNIRQGPLLVWNGEKRLAKITNTAGVWTGPCHNEWGVGGDLCHMFDGNPKTYWHSHSSKENDPKIIKIEFKVCYRSKLSNFFERVFNHKIFRNR